MATEIIEADVSKVYRVKGTELKEIADAIREYMYTPTLLTPTGMAEAIKGLELKG